MKPRRRVVYLSFSLLCSLLFISSAGADQLVAGFSQQRLERLDRSFSALIEKGRNAGFTGLIVRDGKVVHRLKMGWQDRERKIAMQRDTIFRIYSMSKAITSVAALILYEEGFFQLHDPVHNWIPAFEKLRVYAGGKENDMRTEVLQRPITMQDLFTHTSGLVYHFLGATPIHTLYRRKGIMPGVEVLYPEKGDAAPIENLDNMIAVLSTIPLLHQPGERMTYGVSIDVLGHLIEIISGKRFDEFLQQRIFEPLDMVDTGFVVPENKLDRFAANYSWNGNHLELVDDPLKSRYQQQGRILSGGAGLVSTSHDYMQFQLMVVNGGKLGRTRILSRKTLEFALNNHLPRDDITRPGWMKQQGHGLGFALALDPPRMGYLTSKGTADWAGAASTFFWIDRTERLAAVFMTQDMPIKNNALIELGRSLTYQAIVD